MNKKPSLTKTLTSISVAVAAATATAAVCAATTELASAKPAPVSRCYVQQLSTSITPGSPGAGQRYATITLKNVSRKACTTGGYVGLGLTDARGRRLPTDAVRTDVKGAKLYRLAPGQKATELLHWGVIGPSRCVNNAKHLLVTPPNDYNSFIVPWKLGSVCQSGRFLESPIRVAGRGR